MKTFDELFREIMLEEYFQDVTWQKDKPVPEWFIDDYLEDIIRNLIKQVKKEKE